MNNGERSYNLEIYTLKAIKTAIRYYSAICRIDYRVNGNYALCSFCAKEEYIELIESEDFDRQSESAYVSDGEYGYYPVSKFTKNWLEKQPFDYIIRGE